ncbi:MAG: FG-GAP-like repeat-containing protein, partial [Bacteroidota bacterium]
FDQDVDGDGKPEIVMTNYNDLGHVHVFEAAGDDALQLVWSSPRVTTGGGSSTPRYPIFGDLDNDGRKEVIFQVNNFGVLIFEWDGVVGSDNYGTVPSQVITSPIFSGTVGNCEHMVVADVDGDGMNELLIAYNSAPNENDKYYVISAVGEWSTDDPGFSSFTVEYAAIRTNLGHYGLGGSPVAMIPADFDGNGSKDILIHNFNFKNVTILKVNGADTYALIDTAGGTGQLYLSGQGVDDVALFGGMAYDIDGDGRQEVYLPTFPASNSTFGGTVHMISYDPGQSVTAIDASNVSLLSFRDVMSADGDDIGGKSVFGYGWGDIDGNGKPNLYFTSTYPHTVFTAEYQGGDKKDPASWLMSMLYEGESDIYESLTIKDSAGVVDTTARTRNLAFASKIFAQKTDFDGDGFEDIVMPFQAINDSTTVTTITWNQGSSSYDTTRVTIGNPKRWGLRILEATTATGVYEVKDLIIITPNDYRLAQNYPNPFNPSTTLEFFLPVRNRISLRVYDILGKEVRTLINNEEHPSGAGKVVWDGRDNGGRAVATGSYFYTLSFGNFQLTQKMMLLK